MSYAYNGSVQKYNLGSPIYSDHALSIAKKNTRDFTKMGELDQPVIFYYRCSDGSMLELSIKYYTQRIVILSHTLTEPFAMVNMRCMDLTVKCGMMLNIDMNLVKTVPMHFSSSWNSLMKNK